MIELNLRDSRPIYEQIEASFKKLIITGVMKPGDKVPSVRTLATQLSINPNTIQRAYNALEQEGVLYSVPGKGSFVCAGDDYNREHIHRIKEQIRSFVGELRQLNVSDTEILELVKRGENND